MPDHPIPHCACGLALHPYVSLSLHDGLRRQSYVTNISLPAAWTPCAGSDGAARRPLRGVWAVDADDLLRLSDDRAASPHLHDVHFYATTAGGAIERTTAAGHAVTPAARAEGDSPDGC